ncbi:MAG: glycosyltransferase family 87 protein [Novosphingobium sp.]|nr:glycosyltransferase family 87 protein [Novosphingobium sp.]
MRAYLWLLALANALSLVWLLITARGGLDPQGRLLGTDFVSFWAAGQVVLAGANPYDPAVHGAAQAVVWRDQTGYTAFFYPPLFLLWCWPLGLLGYFGALAAWLVASGTAWVLALRAWAGRAWTGRAWAGRIDWLALAAFPPLLISVTHGQTSLLLAALLGGGFLAAVRRQAAVAGVLFGLAAFKPQFGVLVPVVLIAARQWRIIGWAGATVVASVALATLAFGPNVWRDWLDVAGPAQTAMAGGSIGFGKMQSLFAGLRLIGASVTTAYAAQAVLAIGVAAWLARVAWAKGMTREVAVAALAGTLLATPFMLDYDFVLLAFPLILFAQGAPMPWERTIGALVFAVPAFARPLGVLIGVPIAPVIVLALFVLLIRRAVREPVSEA